MVRAIAGHEHAGHIRLRAAFGNDVAILVHGDFSFEQLGVGHVPDRDKYSGAVQNTFRAGLQIFQAHSRDLVLFRVQDLGHHTVPNGLDFWIGQRAFGHDFGGAQRVAAVHQMDRRSKAGQIGRLLAG